MFLKKICVFLMFFMTVGLFAQEVRTGIVIVETGQAGGFKIGGEYRILQYRANVRAGPSRNNNVIAILSLNNQVEILEHSGIVETINGICGTWLKIKYGNIVGYTFSGNLAAGSLATDIDNNGITDYFYFRKSRLYKIDGFSEYKFDFDPYNTQNDIFIYINNKRIKTNKINIDRHSSYINIIKFEEGDNCIIINLFYYYIDRAYGPWIFGVMNYKVKDDGLIEHMGGYESFH